VLKTFTLEQLVSYLTVRQASPQPTSLAYRPAHVIMSQRAAPRGIRFEILDGSSNPNSGMSIGNDARYEICNHSIP